MLAKLDNYTFLMEKSDFDEMTEQFRFAYSEHKRLNNHSSLQAVGAWSQDITVRGLLVQQKMNTLDALVKLASKKEKVRFTTKEDDFDVVITDIQKGKTLYNKDGTFMVQSYNAKMKRVFKQWQMFI